MQVWTDDEEQRLWPYVLRRCHPEYLLLVARDLGRRPAQVRRHRRALRHRARRVRGLAGRAGRLAAEEVSMTTYRTIVADPPWRYKTSLPGFGYNGSGTATPGRGRSVVPYATMTIAEIAALPVRDLADPEGCHLYMWTTNTHLPHAFEIVKGWGFVYSTLLVWAKRPRGFAGFPTYNVCTEYVLFCRRGTLKATERIDRNWWEWKRRRHSAKPEHFLDLVERVSPGPRLEIFSRRHRLGWDVLGDAMSGKTIQQELATACEVA